MRRSVLVVAVLILAAIACWRQAPLSASAATQNKISNTRFAPPALPLMLQPVFLTPAPQQPPNPPVPPPAVEADSQEKYDAALGQGLDLMADGKWEEALTAFETAKSIQSTPTVVAALARVEQHLEMDRAAERIATDIQTILEEGRADEAAKLAADALQQYSETKFADKLANLKRQADALVTSPMGDKKDAFNRFKDQYLAAKKENNLRAAALALEQALQSGDDDDLKKELDSLHDTLSQYDDLRGKAADLRKDPAKMDDALENLRQAAKLWDNPGIQQDIGELVLALQNRRDRLSVASFELRGDIGIPQAGGFVADEILPFFKPKFDLVERSQLSKIAEEMKLTEAELADDEPGRREIGDALKVRYLVVGSITPVGGITVQARIVEVATGLIVQTAEISAATPEELKKKLPDLAHVLMMSDEEKRKLDEQQVNEAPPVEVQKPADNAPIPPPPQPPAPDDVQPPPVIFGNIKPPPVGNLQQNQFQQLPPAPAADAILPQPIFVADPLRDRAFFVALQLGDNLFLRSRFREALYYYQFCLNLYPDQQAVRLRVAQCLALVPPDPIVIVPIFVRPRIAIMDFQVFGNPFIVAPWLGPWTALNIAPYFYPRFDVVSRFEVHWWMWQLGISYRDVLFNPAARWYLGQVLNVRYFLFGTLVETASFNATTYLVDAQFGFLANSAQVHVHNPVELRLRLGELAHLTKMSPAERLKYERDNAIWEALLADIRQRQAGRDFVACRNLCQRALRLRANNVEVLAILQQVERDQRVAALRAEDEALRNRNKVRLNQFQQRQVELARATELARVEAERLAGERGDADRVRLREQRRQAALNLITQARALVQQQRFQNSIALFESAVALQPNDDALLRELALARAKAEETARANAAEAVAAKERALREQREKELATVRQRLDKEREQQATLELARRKLMEDRDRKEFDRLVDLAQQLAAKQKFDQAVSVAAEAKQLRNTPEIDRLLSQLQMDLARFTAEKKGAAAKAELERQLAQEKDRRLAAEKQAEEAKRKYEMLLAQAQQELKAEQFAAAIDHFKSAKSIHATDIVLTGIQQAENGITRLKAKDIAQKEEQARKEQQAVLLKKQMADAETAMAGKDFNRAAALYREAQKLDPKNETILVGLTKAEHAREQEQFLQSRKGENDVKKANFDKLLASGKANLANKNYPAAVLSLTEATKLFPDNADAKAALAQAQANVATDEAAKADLQRKAGEYQKFMADGRQAMKLKQFDKAREAFKSALAQVPGDEAAKQLILDAANAKASADADAAKQKDAARKALDLTNAINKARIALAAGKLEEAATAIKLAAQIDAANADVVKLQAEIKSAQDANQLAMKKKQADFDNLLTKGEQALGGQKFDEAVQLATQALKLFPTDKKAGDLLARATKARDGSGMAAKQAKFKQLITEANTAIAARRLDDAAKLLTEAAQITASDPALTQAQATLRQAQQQMTLYTNALADANKAFQAKRYDDALKATAAALKVYPGDKDALALQKQIETNRGPDPATMALEQKKKDFAKLMLSARTSFAVKKYDDASKAVQAALTLFPIDADALKLQAEIKAAATTPMPMPMVQQQYAKQMDAGAASEKQGRYDLALTAYQAALKLLPNDDKASKKVEFCKDMLDGARALAAKKFPDAVKAYEAALMLFPDDANAKQGLTRAKGGK
jgi:tetratricopeptide (TPR) repeat protein